MAGLDQVLETTAAERPATGFVFTEGPLWHPDDFYYFADVRASRFYRLRLGHAPETVRTETGEGNGTTFDLNGRLVICEGGNRRVTRWSDDRTSEVLMDRYEGRRINRPNDVICKSDGSIWFTDPGLRVPLADKELAHSGVYAVNPDGSNRLVAEFEYPNGLAFSPDERVLYVANTRHAQYIHAIELDGAGISEQDVRGPNLGIFERALSAMSDEDAIGVTFGFDEHFREGGVRGIGAMRDQGELDIAGEFDFTAPSGAIGHDEPADFDVVLGSNSDFHSSFDAGDAAEEVGVIGAKCDGTGAPIAA